VQLDRVRRKEIDRLLLLCPPQHGKSEMTSRKFPALLLGEDPTRDVIAASATAELADGFGRDVRNTIMGGEYQSLFPDTQLSEDSQAKGAGTPRRAAPTTRSASAVNCSAAAAWR
jgi:hypothetical protein